ncbi:unnamed protein product [Allacma fusca]|uniref:Lipase domain-containing protein n=1 Tax=Allacma fusca TaxID=39272 RepID=A0A8J2NTQ0_9HEXA|nr:unnamed protein product [Allacma fusca]
MFFRGDFLIIFCACVFLKNISSLETTTPEINLLPVNYLLKFINKLENCVKRDPNLIRFYVANNLRNSSSYTEIILNDILSLQNSGLVRNLPLKVLIHGIDQSLTAQFPQDVKNAYLRSEQILTKNILIVDYGAMANIKTESQLNGFDYPICYVQAVLNTATAGTRIAQLIQFIMDNGYAQLNDTHIIGHSLGGHVGGFAANHLQTLNGGKKPARLTALDPAAPGFRPKVLPVRPMTPDDAIFVDVIHTNQICFGVLGPVGQVDIFVNFALFLQPPCVGNITLKGFLVETLPDVLSLGSWCSHGASITYFSQSISDSLSVATGVLGATGHTAILGENCSPSTYPGQYLYLEGNFNPGTYPSLRLWKPIYPDFINNALSWRS